jgi:hypothetical protein
MKHAKMLGLAAVVLASMAFVGAGSAAAKEGVYCSTKTEPCTVKWAINTVLDKSLKPGGTVILKDTSNNTLTTCSEGTWKGTLKANPGATGTAEWKNTAFQWGGCTATTDTSVLGAMKVEAESEGSGLIYAAEEIKITINVFGSCEYGFTAGTQLGTVNASGEFTFNAVASRLNSCLGPLTARWTGTWVKTEPALTTEYISHK